MVPAYIFGTVILSIFSYIISKHDKPLGLFCLYLCIQGLFLQSFSILFSIFIIISFAAALCILRRMPDSYKKYSVWALISICIIQILYALTQTLYIDVLFFGLERLEYKIVHGTFGHRTFFGAFVAIVTPLFAPRFLFIPLVGLVLADSVLAFAAAGAALLWKYRKNSYTWPISVGILALMIYMFHWKSWDSYFSRKYTWSIAFDHIDNNWLDLLFGRGIGQWYYTIPNRLALQGALDLYHQAHNEYLQLFYETGLVGLVFLVWWMWKWRDGFKYGSMIAIAICAFGTYPFHLIQVVSVMVLVIALHTREETTCLKDSSHRYYS